MKVKVTVKFSVHSSIIKNTDISYIVLQGVRLRKTSEYSGKSRDK